MSAPVKCFRNFSRAYGFLSRCFRAKWWDMTNWRSPSVFNMGFWKVTELTTHHFSLISAIIVNNLQIWITGLSETTRSPLRCFKRILDRHNGSWTGRGRSDCFFHEKWLGVLKVAWSVSHTHTAVGRGLIAMATAGLAYKVTVVLNMVKHLNTEGRAEGQNYNMADHSVITEEGWAGM